MGKYLIVSVLFFCSTICSAQNLEELETQIADLSAELSKERMTDSLMEAKNNQIAKLVEQAISKPESFEYPFSQVKTMGFIYSPDRAFRIISWVIPLSEFRHKYTAYIQYYEGKEKKYRFVKLLDNPNDIANIDTKTLSPENWYGALYYKVIERKYKKEKVYVVLGYDLGNAFSKKKYIDVIKFNRNGTIDLGASVFELKDKKPKRIVLEYNREANVSVNYNDQSELIIYDHLSPIQDGLEGQPQYYGPDMSYDALKYKRGRWVLVTDVDARNPKSNLDDIKHKDTNPRNTP